MKSPTVRVWLAIAMEFAAVAAVAEQGHDVVSQTLDHVTWRGEPWAVGNLDFVISGLKGRGFCFESLRQHPPYKDWIKDHGG